MPPDPSGYANGRSWMLLPVAVTKSVCPQIWPWKSIPENRMAGSPFIIKWGEFIKPVATRPTNVMAAQEAMRRRRNRKSVHLRGSPIGPSFHEEQDSLEVVAEAVALALALPSPLFSSSSFIILWSSRQQAAWSKLLDQKSSHSDVHKIQWRLNSNLFASSTAARRLIDWLVDWLNCSFTSLNMCLWHFFNSFEQNGDRIAFRDLSVSRFTWDSTLIDASSSCKKRISFLKWPLPYSFNLW